MRRSRWARRTSPALGKQFADIAHAEGVTMINEGGGLDGC